MITLPEAPRLVPPTTTVRISYLTGEQADLMSRLTGEQADPVLPGTGDHWLGPASEDFDAFVAARLGVKQRWGVPSTVFWYVAGEHYLGTLVIRHDLTPGLFADGGHIGYHVVAPWRRQGHATRMLAAGLAEARAIGLDRVLLTCDANNEPSRRVIVANGGVPDEQLGNELRFWIGTGQRPPADCADDRSTA